MAKWTYDEALRRLLAHEGGYTNHPSDPGGPTNYGITLADYRRYVKPHATAADVRAMNVAEAKEIYRRRYWDALRCDELPAGVDYSVFDYGVNSGISRASKVVQRVVGVEVDGQIGPATLAAIGRRDQKALINAICDERLAFLQRLRTWPAFGRGWGRRVAEVRAAGLRMASAKEPSAQTFAPDAAPAPGKALIPAPLAERAKTWIVGTGALAPLAAGGAFWHWIAAHPWAFAGVACGGGLIVVEALFILNRWLDCWRQRRQDAPLPDTPLVPELPPASGLPT